MSITKQPSQLVLSDFPCVCVRDNGDGTVTLYYVGDSIPLLPVPTQAQLDAIAAQMAKDLVDAQAAKTYGKLQAMMGMSPSEIRAWVVANVTTLSAAQDAIATLATAISVLARRL